MATDSDGSEWLRPLKVLEHYVLAVFPDDTLEAERQLYLAVASGDIRARVDGHLVSPEWRKRMRRMTFLPNNTFTLGPDLELSVEDARREFGT
jgi:hypothetical protein